MGANNNPGLSQAGGWGGLSPPPPQFLAEQLTLSQQGGHIMPTTVLQGPQKIFGPCDGPAIKQLCYNFGKYNQTQGLVDEVLG